eukprot:gene29412-35502_t
METCDIGRGSGSNLIEVLSEPQEFHRTLVDQIRSAKTSIILSALYIGTEKIKERELIQAIADSLADETRPNLEISLILDFSRTRRAFSSFEEAFLPLTKRTQQQNRLHVFLYELPSQRAHQRGILGKIVNRLHPQVREMLGVYHSKFAVFDEKMAILTGANLSEEYFVQRQDRYHVVRYRQVVQLLVGFARLISYDSYVYRHGVLHPPEGGSTCVDMRIGVEKLLEDFVKESPLDVPGKSSDMCIVPLVQFPHTGVRDEELVLSQILHALATSQSLKYTALPSSALSRLFTSLSFSHRLQDVQIVSPYPNISPTLLPLSLSLPSTPSSCSSSNRAEASILTSSPQCHGFAAGRGVKAYLPYLHLLALHQALQSSVSQLAVQKRSARMEDAASTAGSEVCVRLFDRAGWTFHAKGLWCHFTPNNHHPLPDTNNDNHNASSSSSNRNSNSDRNSDSGGNGDIHATYIGSSNLSLRSHHRDVELGFVFLSRAPSPAISKWRDEYRRISEHSQPAARFLQLGLDAVDRKLAWWEKVLLRGALRVVRSLL